MIRVNRLLTSLQMFGVMSITAQLWLKWEGCVKCDPPRGDVRRLCAALGVPLTE